MREKNGMHEEQQVIKDLLNDLDRAVNRLAWLGFLDHSGTLYEFVLSLEDKLIQENKFPK